MQNKTKTSSNRIAQMLELDLTADSPLKTKLPPKSPNISSKKKLLAKTSSSPLKRNPFSEYVIIEKSVPKSSSIKEAEVIDLSDDEGDSRCALIARSSNKFPLKRTVPVTTIPSDSNSSSENDDSDDGDSSIVLLDSTPVGPYSSSSSSSYDALSSDDSDLQVLEPQMKLNISGSLESTLITKCTPMGHFPTDWKAFSSKRWTPEMIEFYDKDGADAELGLILQSLPANSQFWLVNKEDRYDSNKGNRYFGKKNLRCLNCNQPDHVSRHCPKPKKVLSCVMCGFPGHKSQTCPNSCCLGCGRPSQSFTQDCSECLKDQSTSCGICQLSHVTNQCPDLWRRYHSTVTGQELPDETPPSIKSAQQLFCSNCAGLGHNSFDCPEKRTSNVESRPRQGSRERRQKIIVDV